MTDSKAPETKINVRERIVKLMKDNNYEPFLELIRIGKDPDSNLKLRADIASTLAEFVAPKLKGIDVDSKTSGSVRVVVQTFAEAEEQAKTLEMALCLDSEEKEPQPNGN